MDCQFCFFVYLFIYLFVVFVICFVYYPKKEI